MVNIETTKLLDATLDILYDKPDLIYTDFIAEELENMGLLPLLSDSKNFALVRSALIHLSDDGYAIELKSEKEPNVGYIISLQGRILYELGGYYQKHLDITRDHERLKNVEEVALRNEKRIADWTRYAVIVACIVFAYQITKDLLPLLLSWYKKCC